MVGREPGNRRGRIIIHAPAVDQDTSAGRMAEHVLAAERLGFELINAERQRTGLRPYTLMDRLALVARRHSQDMAEREYCSHFSPEGIGPMTRLARGGLGYQALGENVSLITLPHEPQTQAELEAAVREAHAGFMNSPGHRRAILEPGRLTHAAVGVAVAGNHVGVTQLFIRPGQTTTISTLFRLSRLLRLALGGR